MDDFQSTASTLLPSWDFNRQLSHSERHRRQVPGDYGIQSSQWVEANHLRRFEPYVDEVLHPSPSTPAMNLHEYNPDTEYHLASEEPLYDGFDRPPTPIAEARLSRDASASGPMSFMDWYPAGDGTLTFTNDANQLEAICNVNVSIIAQRCLVLASAFEEFRSGPKLHLETLTSATAQPFLEFLYSGEYTIRAESGDSFCEDVPTSLLSHAGLYRLGDIYGLPHLKTHAYLHILRQCEFACSSPDKPIDLCAAIRFIYAHLTEHENVLDAVINYCVSCFLTHRLAEDEPFKALAYELRPFHQDLCKNSMNREFENETASAIIQMPFKPYSPATYASRDDPFSVARGQDLVYHFHAEDKYDALARNKRKRPEMVENKQISPMSLPFRFRGEPSKVVEKETGKGEKGDMVDHKRPAPASWAGPAPPRSPTSPSADFEVFQGPAPVEVLSDSESDASTLVDVTHEELEETVTFRPRAPHRRADTAEADGSGSESEWTLV